VILTINVSQLHSNVDTYVVCLKTEKGMSLIWGGFRHFESTYTELNVIWSHKIQINVCRKQTSVLHKQNIFSYLEVHLCILAV